MDRDAEHFVETFVKELEEENIAIFAGAGLSVGAGYVDWRKLLQPIAHELGLDIDMQKVIDPNGFKSRNRPRAQILKLRIARRIARSHDGMLA
jgi:NAD-dependent SIR2 family protein deacetylase